MKIKLFLFLIVLPLQLFAQAGSFNIFIKDLRTRSSLHPRDIYVYLPPNFSFSYGTRYPVLYMHDGQNLFDPSRSTFGQTWEMEETLNDLISRKLIPPIIVVGIDNTPDRTQEYTHVLEPSRSIGGSANEYLDFIVYDLKPYIDKVFPTAKGRKTTGIMGSSLGGLVSLYAGAIHQDTFGLIGAMSPSVWWANKSILKLISASRLPRRVYIDSGELNGERPEDAKEAYLVYKKKGLEDLFLFIDSEGEHNEKSWARRLPQSLVFLFQDI